MNDLSFFQRLTRRLGILYDAIAFNFYGLIVLLLIYLFYWTFPQAKDLLLTLNQEGPFQVTLFFVTLVTIAAINWYLPRYLYPKNNSKLTSWRTFFESKMDEHRVDSYDIKTFRNDEAYRMRMIEMVPRLIGAFLLMVVGLGVLNVGHEMDPQNFPWFLPANLLLLGLILLTALLLLVGRTGNPWMFAFSDWLKKGISKWIYGFFLSVSILLLIFLFFNKGDFNSLKFLMYSIILIAFAFLFIAMARRQIKWVNKDEWVIKIICFFSIALSIYFVIINIKTSWAQALNPLICANLAFIFYLSLLYFFRIVGISLKTYFVFFFLLAVIIIANMTTSARLHEITYSTGESAQFNSEKRISLEQYFERWIDQRSPEIEQYLADHQALDSTQSIRYPIVLVSSEGGGSRAAYWTNIVHNYLDQQIPGYYDRHLFAMSGASGGNTGNSIYFSMKQSGVKQDSIHAYAHNMFSGNFLSSSLTLLLGSDLWQSTFGLHLTSDRANLLGYEWEKQIKTVSHQEVTNYADPFLSFWYESGNTQLKQQKMPPVLIINTTHVQEGGHAVISPVQFNALHYSSLDLIHAVDTMSKGEKTIPLNTAVLLNASFPYINPAGNIKNVGSFVDAGYYDNYGAEIGEGILKHLKYFRDSMSRSSSSKAQLYEQLQFVAVLIRNGTVDPLIEAPTASSQVIAPASTLANLRRGFNTRSKWNLQQAADPLQYYILALPHRDNIKIMVPGEEDPISPIIPLARYLSASALVAMDTGLIILKNNPTSDLNRLVRVLK